MAQGRSTQIISIIKWIRTSELSLKNFLSQVGGGMAPYRAREVGMAPYYGGYGNLFFQVGTAPYYVRWVWHPIIAGG